MKLKVNVFDSAGNVYFKKDGYCVMAGTKLLGTTELDIEPVKKEVVKEVAVETTSWINGICIPKDAYDVKLVYKVKE